MGIMYSALEAPTSLSVRTFQNIFDTVISTFSGEERPIEEKIGYWKNKLRTMTGLVLVDKEKSESSKGLIFEFLADGRYNNQQLTAVKCEEMSKATHANWLHYCYNKP